MEQPRYNWVKYQKTVKSPNMDEGVQLKHWSMMLQLKTIASNYSHFAAI